MLRRGRGTWVHGEVTRNCLSPAPLDSIMLPCPTTLPCMQPWNLSSAAGVLEQRCIHARSLQGKLLRMWSMAIQTRSGPFQAPSQPRCTPPRHLNHTSQHSTSYFEPTPTYLRTTMAPCSGSVDPLGRGGSAAACSSSPATCAPALQRKAAAGSSGRQRRIRHSCE